MKIIPKQLFKTFLISVILSIAANSIYYASMQKGADITNALTTIMEDATFLNIVIFIMSLPALFLASPVYWNNLTVRLLLYFAGSIIFIVTALSLKIQPANRVVYLLSGGIFLIVHSVFYYFTVKKARQLK
ncbi:hypothetical protein [Mucilaginibacter pocheonensis]|uniref:Uncharacterized protein n=1 Tax=Mucilaginibacter pocheonensis TaxID=398050 RepID=A0ABU1TGN2_9SPHI|nr:hypothetical protein [Mucilaginibacter pocheonensis]MDR6944589.1 hypothetical protein [Mucilaginibacter pocheonensis]